VVIASQNRLPAQAQIALWLVFGRAGTTPIDCQAYRCRAMREQMDPAAGGPRRAFLCALRGGGAPLWR